MFLKKCDIFRSGFAVCSQRLQFLHCIHEILSLRAFTPAAFQQMEHIWIRRLFDGSQHILNPFFTFAHFATLPIRFLFSSHSRFRRAKYSLQFLLLQVYRKRRSRQLFHGLWCIRRAYPCSGKAPLPSGRSILSFQDT